jgi:WD40 repeat protein
MKAIDFHAGPVSCVDTRADGMLASGGYDASVLLWSAAGRPLARFVGHRALVNGVRFAPDGARLASASSDHTARVWDVATGACLAALEGHEDDVNGVAWSPDGTRVATASFDGSTRVFDAATGACLAELRGHDGDVNGVAWSPDGTLLATASDDRTVRLFTPRASPARCSVATRTGWTRSPSARTASSSPPRRWTAACASTSSRAALVSRCSPATAAP